MKSEPEHLSLGHIKWLAGFTIVGLLPLVFMVTQSLKTDGHDAAGSGGTLTPPTTGTSGMKPSEVVQLTSGRSGKTTYSDACAVLDASTEDQTGRWIVRGASLADIDSPQGWNVTQSGDVIVPQSARSGTYFATVYTDIPCKPFGLPNVGGVVYRQMNFTVQGLPPSALPKLALREKKPFKDGK
jgi:hypothetical protein